MKTTIKFNIYNYYIIVLLSFFLIHCYGSSKNNEQSSRDKSKITQIEPLNDSVQLQEKGILLQKTEYETHKQISEFKNSENEILNDDPNKIYEQSEVDKEAVCPFSNAQLAEFSKKNFKNDGKIAINGVIKTDMIIEKDGSVSDVILVEGLHPVIDKEAIRALKLMPNFIPGEIRGKPVRSKFRMPMYCLSM